MITAALYIKAKKQKQASVHATNDGKKYFDCMFSENVKIYKYNVVLLLLPLLPTD